MKIALVHDYLVQHGGAERVLECFCEMFPHAPIYTLIYDKDVMGDTFSDRDIITSSLQKMPFARKRHRVFPLLMTSAIEEFDFSHFDVVLSDSSSFAKGIITRPETLHISYVHTPMRYAWDDCQKYTSDFGFPKMVEQIVPFIMNGVRLWDRISSDRVDYYVANSQFVARRIKKYYNKDAIVVNPPVNVHNFYLTENKPKEEYYLMVGRLIAYKRHDIAIDAFNRLGDSLKIIGRGPEITSLKRQAHDNIEFLARVDDDELARYYAEAKAFIFPQEEDFGIVAIEAMASGRPIIAYRGGDIVEHLTHGETGLFFNDQTADSLEATVREFDKHTFDSSIIRQRSLQFDRENFKRTMRDYIEKTYKKHIEQRRRG
ncbi:MAG: glycosyl transferase [Candidatus Moraniibacteriota bacterium]|nr:MAG: glycosyl transferase [Candidatus Moranbacteria bacterium]